jgi:hypothetical protein
MKRVESRPFSAASLIQLYEGASTYSPALAVVFTAGKSTIGNLTGSEESGAEFELNTGGFASESFG